MFKGLISVLCVEVAPLKSTLMAPRRPLNLTVVRLMSGTLVFACSMNRRNVT